MEIRNLDTVVGGMRYRTQSSTLIARAHWPDEKDNDDSALATTLLYRTGKGRYFRQIQSHDPLLRDQIESINRDEAMQEFLQMPVQLVSTDEAFPGMNIEEA